MSTELVPMAERTDAWLPVLTIENSIARRDAVVAFVKSCMYAGTDFGVIPGTGDKPTLLKPGAEKLCTLFGLTKRMPLARSVEDWTGDDHSGEPFFYYVYRCELWRGDLLIAEADGSCNSWEKKYRWRKAERECPICGLANTRASKDGGFYCWKKTGGCGSTFDDDDPRITGQSTGLVRNPDVADQVNTIQKMAQKRALVAATLLAVNASEFFTQDLEDTVTASEPAATAAPAEPTNGAAHAVRPAERASECTCHAPDGKPHLRGCPMFESKPRQSRERAPSQPPADVEAEERAGLSRQWFAARKELLGDVSDERDRQILSRLVGRTVESRTSLTAAEWERALSDLPAFVEQARAEAKKRAPNTEPAAQAPTSYDPQDESTWPRDPITGEPDPFAADAQEKANRAGVAASGRLLDPPAPAPSQTRH